jgi:hypothetical protein
MVMLAMRKVVRVLLLTAVLGLTGIPEIRR